jgi:hypothetical protein
MKRIGIGLVAAALGCGGGGSKQEAAEPAPVIAEEPPPPPEPTWPDTGAATCDELAILTWCLTQGVPEAEEIALDATAMYRDALANPSTHDAVVEGCRQAIPSTRDAAQATGCDATARPTAAQLEAWASRPPEPEPEPLDPSARPEPTGDPGCDELVAITWCMAADVDGAKRAVLDIAVMYRDALAGPGRDATIDGCAAALPSTRDAAKALGC